VVINYENSLHDSNFPTAWLLNSKSLPGEQDSCARCFVPIIAPVFLLQRVETDL
jgi:hypothetical protein